MKKKNRSLKVRLRAWNISQINPPLATKYSEEEAVCKNCGHSFAGNFCPQCGQDAKVGPLRVVDIPKNIFGAFFNIDGGFGSTLRQLVTRPGYLIRDFLQGKRARYFRPFQTLFVLAAIYILVAMVFNPKAMEELDLSTETTTETNAGEGAKAEEEENIMAWLFGIEEDEEIVGPGLLRNTLDTLGDLYNGNKVFNILFGIIFVALAYRKAFKKKVTGVHYNFVEYIFIATYIEVQILMYGILILPFNSDANIHRSDDLPTLVTLAIYCYNFKQLFGMSWKMTVWRTLWGSAIMWIYFFIFVLGIMLVGTAWKYLF